MTKLITILEADMGIDAWMPEDLNIDSQWKLTGG
jgi:hypothetical protein